MIIDCFTFYNELELLEIRLNYLDPVVDKFILVEAVKTHSGLNKPLFFDENKLLFKQFLHKIVHVIVDDMPTVDYTGDRWRLENYQRNCISKGLDNLNPESKDYILISDLDEIPNRELVSKQVFGCYDMLCFMYYLNTPNDQHWPGTVGLEYDRIKGHYGTIQKIRDSRQQIEPIRNGGWHFGWLGGYDRVYQKIKAFAHSEIDSPHIMDVLKHSVENTIPLWCPNGGPIPTTPIEYDTFPDYIVDNQEKFKELIHA
jgi:beta-1,4-mannosyl-glycoprotein beta-1,4-N-acetylglucosaminyltransferase